MTTGAGRLTAADAVVSGAGATWTNAGPLYIGDTGVGTLDDPRAKEDPQSAALAAWSLVHGFAMLWLNGAIDSDADPIATVERVAGMLYR